MKIFFIFCAICCFVALFPFPISYYRFLRIIVFVGALLAIYTLWKPKKNFWAFVFLAIAILFNPIFPIYLYAKKLWMPFDLGAGILFLLISFLNIKEKKDDKPEEKTTEENLSTTTVHHRDRIVNSRKN